MNYIYIADNLHILKTLPAETIDLIYIDPPFGTNKEQVARTISAMQSADGLLGFGNKKYDRIVKSVTGYSDKFSDYWEFLFPRLQELYRVLKPTGTIYVHADYRNIHYIRIMLDIIFGDENYLGEIIWAWDFGARQKNKWPTKHNNILYYSKTKEYYFDLDAADKIPYMTPGLVGPEKAAFGKSPTDVWWLSIEGTNSRLRTGYPNQKPYKLLERIISVSSKPGQMVLDAFAGSGITGRVAGDLGRNAVMIDNNGAALDSMKRLLIDIPYEIR